VARLSEYEPADGCREIRPTWYLRVALVLGVAALQLGTFFWTYKLYAIIPYSTYINVEIAWDRSIPYLEWSWVVYYFGFAYIVFWGAAGIWRMSMRVLLRTIGVYCAMVLIGTVLRLAIPTETPWQFVRDLSAVQHNFKITWNIEPLACFPSMHVAMAILPAFISLYEFKSAFNRVISVILALSVSASVVTAKEHWLLDACGGLALGLVAGWVWRIYALKIDVAEEAVQHTLNTTSKAPDPAG
jgi:PAP2 superfamily